MPHLRARHADSHVREALRFSPLVGIVGQRQVGKTTLARQIVGDAYATLDDEDTLASATSFPSRFLEQFSKPTAIDECQKAPALFSALKLRVQNSPRPGQFLLTGSVRFTSRRAIEESLTGRLHCVEILPMTQAEIEQNDLDDFTRWVTMDARQLKAHFKAKLQRYSALSIETAVEKGGLPGICFLRKEGHRNAKFKSHLQTLLQRDLRLVLETTVPYQNILLLLKFIAESQGIPFIIREASQYAGIAQNTVKKLTFAFESLFLVRRFLGDGDRKGDTYYSEDQGVATFLATQHRRSAAHRFAFSQLYAQAHYHHMNEFTMTYFETKGGAFVPWVLQIGRERYAFILDEGLPGRSPLKDAQVFLSRHPKAFVILVSNVFATEKLGRSIIRVPLQGIA